MTKTHIFKEWLYASFLSFFLYELLWCLLVEHSFDIGDWGFYCFDLLYCAMFTASSIGISELIARTPMFGKLTLRRQMVLCVLILAVNLVLAYLFENAYAQIYPESSEYENYAGIYLFCFIATLLTTTNNVVHYCQLILEQREQLVKLRKQMFKNKLDPHFVFNSLSVLTELIHQEPTKAEKYSIQFSRLYRHLLADINSYIVPIRQGKGVIETSILPISNEFYTQKRFNQ